MFDHFRFTGFNESKFFSIPLHSLALSLSSLRPLFSPSPSPSLPLPFSPSLSPSFALVTFSRPTTTLSLFSPSSRFSLLFCLLPLSFPRFSLLVRLFTPLEASAYPFPHNRVSLFLSHSLFLSFLPSFVLVIVSRPTNSPLRSFSLSYSLALAFPRFVLFLSRLRSLPMFLTPFASSPFLNRSSLARSPNPRGFFPPFPYNCFPSSSTCLLETTNSYALSSPDVLLIFTHHSFTYLLLSFVAQSSTSRTAILFPSSAFLHHSFYRFHSLHLLFNFVLFSILISA